MFILTFQILLDAFPWRGCSQITSSSELSSSMTAHSRIKRSIVYTANVFGVSLHLASEMLASIGLRLVVLENSNFARTVVDVTCMQAIYVYKGPSTLLIDCSGRTLQCKCRQASPYSRPDIKNRNIALLRPILRIFKFLAVQLDEAKRKNKQERRHILAG